MVIKIENLTKKYSDVVAVNNINLEIKEGELFALLGVNGAGKTTLINMLATLTNPSDGDAYIYGYSIKNDEDKVKELIDISMQETAIARRLTVDENIEFYARLNGLTKKQIEERKIYLYKIFELENVKNKIASKLSGGYQRKLSIALSLITMPKILFLDEPTLGLDVLARRELWKAIKHLKKSMTIILTTHYMEEAQELADRIGIMQKGNILFCGCQNELYKLTNTCNIEDAFVNLVSGGEKND